jgi:hypothetical protein
MSHYIGSLYHFKALNEHWRSYIKTAYEIGLPVMLFIQVVHKAGSSSQVPEEVVMLTRVRLNYKQEMVLQLSHKKEMVLPPRKKKEMVTPFEACVAICRCGK